MARRPGGFGNAKRYVQWAKKHYGDVMTSERQLILEEEIATTDELVERLRASHHYWDGPSRTWGFRGQANACWPLMPTAFRISWDSFLPVNKISTKSDKLKAQQINEKQAFERFVELADRIDMTP